LRRTGSPNLADVAREAGVDISTASRALNGRIGPRSKVRERVLEAARRLNYRPNPLGRALVLGRTRTIGLLVSDIRNPFMTDLARAVEETAHQAGFDLLLCNSGLDRDKQMQYFSALLDKRVGGLILNFVPPLDRAQHQQIAASGIPVVLLSPAPRGSPLSTVCCENLRGGELVGEYLIRLGHRRLAHLTGSLAHPNFAARWRGFRRTVRTLAPECQLVLLRGMHDFQGGYAMAQGLLRHHPHVTGVFAANDAIAFGALAAFHAAGVKIPDDVSLVGFDDVELASIAHPPLTTVHQPVAEIGRAAVEIISRHWHNALSAPVHLRFSVSLVERDSCRAI